MQDGNVCCMVEILCVHQEQQPACAAGELDLASLIFKCVLGMLLFYDFYLLDEINPVDYLFP